jgi:hypothetical protein
MILSSLSIRHTDDTSINQDNVSTCTLHAMQIFVNRNILFLVENFLLAESDFGEEKILIFGRDANLDLLQRSFVWYVDGTFSIAPNLFAQVQIFNFMLVKCLHSIIQF